MNTQGSFWFLIYALVIVAVTGWGCYEYRVELMAEPFFSAMVRNVGLVVGGFIAIGLAVWRGIVAEMQAETAARQTAIAEQQAESNRESLIDERYRRAVELLSHDESYIRIGAMHALEDLACRYPDRFSRNATTLLGAYMTHGGIARSEQREIAHQDESEIAEIAIERIEGRRAYSEEMLSIQQDE